MMKYLIVTGIVWLLPLGALAARSEISAAVLAITDQQLEVGAATLTVPAASSDKTVVVKLRQKERLHKADVPRIAKKFRSKQRVYGYSLDRELQTPATVTVQIPLSGKSTIRRVFWLGPGKKKWQKLPTTLDPIAKTLTAELPGPRGKVVAAKHRYKKARPKKNADFTDFGAPSYSQTAAVLDVTSGKFLYRYKAKTERPIASISKVLTVLTFLNTDPNLDSLMTYRSSSDRIGARVSLTDGTVASRKFFTMAALIPSANNAAVTLSTATDMSAADFVSAMNQTAQDIGAKKTHVNEPTGLDSGNVSTAGNVAKLACHAFTRYPDIFQEAVDLHNYPYTFPSTGESITLVGTNKFDGHGKYVLHGYKTGYLPGSADRTLVVLAEELATGNQIVAVLLGNPEYNTIFQEMYELVDWTFTNWQFTP